ncbi:MAG: LysR family transcriptional regulator [Myxococcota bacterium]
MELASLRTSDIYSAHDLLPNLVAFIVVVESGGYSAGARRTRSDKATLSRRVRALEDALKVRLLDRTTRSVRMTDAGRGLFRQTSERLRDVLMALGDLSELPVRSGPVRVTTVPGLVEDLWVPVLLALRRTHPRIDVTLHSGITFQRLVASGFDVGVRTGKLPETNEIAKKLATWRYLMVSSPEWLAQHSELAAPSGEIPWLIHANVPRASEWRFERGAETLDLNVTPAMASDDAVLLRKLAVEGVGVYLSAPAVVHQDLMAGRLVRAFPNWRVSHVHHIYSVVPHREYVPGPVQAVLARVAGRLAELEQAWSAYAD